MKQTHDTSVTQDPQREREHNDCAVVAHAHVVGSTYSEAHRALALHGRKPRRGTKATVSRAALKQVATVTDIPVTYSTVTQTISCLPKSGRYWIAAGGHAFAYIDGEIKDNLPRSKSRARVRACWRVELNRQASDLTQEDINGMMARLEALEKKLNSENKA
jgi:hypothetical protein